MTYLMSQYLSGPRDIVTCVAPHVLVYMQRLSVLKSHECWRLIPYSFIDSNLNLARPQDLFTSHTLQTYSQIKMRYM